MANLVEPLVRPWEARVRMVDSKLALFALRRDLLMPSCWSRGSDDGGKMTVRDDHLSLVLSSEGEGS